MDNEKQDFKKDLEQLANKSLQILKTATDGNEVEKQQYDACKFIVDLHSKDKTNLSQVESFADLFNNIKGSKNG